MKQQLKIYKVKGNPLNPRLIKNDKFKKLVNSIISIPAFMKLRPIILDEDFMVIGGNMRLKAHHHLNRKEIWTDMFTQADCDEMNVLAEKEERETKTYLEYCNEITIKDNVSAGEWEYDMLANEWDSVQLNDFGLDVWENEDDKVTEGLIDDDEIPEVKESKVKRGDIWKLGEHRVMCGDSTSSDDVAKLMNGEKADMVFTDPPYGMDFSGGIHADGSKSYNAKHGKIKNDKMSEQAGDDFLDKINTNIKDFNRGAFYITFYRLGISKFYNSLNRVGLKCRSLVIWNKGNHTLSNSDYMSKYEPIFYGWVDEHNFYGGNNGMDIWDIKRTSKNELHPTMKPIELCEKGLKDGSIKSQLVLDLFLGSGSTLIAAEKLKRKCYGMELDEKYCDVIINRWEQFTGNKAEKIN
jgi:DNA modification methylase